MKYAEIRNQYQRRSIKSAVLVDYYATLISPVVTKLCLRLHMIPNVVTLCMMGSGILGACFFILPYLWAKILGTLFIHLWYVFDCSDGEVARITKRFSKFGTEIDYAAHVINHPLFLLAFVVTLLRAGSGWEPLTVSLIFFGILALNMVYRNTVVFRKIYEWKTQDSAAPAAPSTGITLKTLVIFGSNMFVQLPNFCLIFPLVYFFSVRAALWYSVIVLCFSAIFVPISILGWLRRIVFQ